jgi:hypothetical protein
VLLFGLSLAVQGAPVTSGFQFTVFAGAPYGVQDLILNGNITLEAFATGSYSPQGVAGGYEVSAGNDGFPNDPNYYTDSFFAFDLSGLTNVEITSAVLSVGNSPGGYFSTIGQKDLGVYDVSTPISALIAGQPNPAAIFSDLQSGTIYGAVGTGNWMNGSQVNIALNQYAIDDIQSNEGSSIALGTAIVPEPSTSLFAALGLAMIAGYRVRRNRTGKA